MPIYLFEIKSIFYCLIKHKQFESFCCCRCTAVSRVCGHFETVFQCESYLCCYV